jgi:hypothetical protein
VVAVAVLDLLPIPQLVSLVDQVVVLAEIAVVLLEVLDQVMDTQA